MTPLAYVLIVVVPLIAFITMGLALRTGRPAPGRSLSSAAIQARIAELDAATAGSAGSARSVGSAGSSAGELKALRRERAALHRELSRRGLGRFPGC